MKKSKRGRLQFFKQKSDLIMSLVRMLCLLPYLLWVMVCSNTVQEQCLMGDNILFLSTVQVR